MYKLRAFLAVAVAALVVVPGQVSADKFTEAAKVFKDSDVVAPYFTKSYGYAIFPTIGRCRGYQHDSLIGTVGNGHNDTCASRNFSLCTL